MQLSLKRLLNDTSEPPTLNHSFHQPESSNHSNNSPRGRKKPKLGDSPRTRNLLSLDFILNTTNAAEGSESSKASYKQPKSNFSFPSKTFNSPLSLPLDNLKASYFTSRIINYEFVTVCFTPKGTPWSYHPKGGGGLQLAMVRRHIEEYSSANPD